MPEIQPKDCLRYGFTAATELDPAALTPVPAVREMCAANRCGMYGKCWSCPPAAPSLEALRDKMHAYSRGILLQYTAHLEDPFDLDGMQAAERACKKAFDALTAALSDAGYQFMPLSAGACTRCKHCTYPDAPCRFPARLAPSMEACGLVVSQVCEQCGVPYYYGPNTLTYVCAVLFQENAHV